MTKIKLVAIYNVWNDFDVLGHSIRNIRGLVDGILVIASTKSNYGEHSPIPEEFKNEELHVKEPHFNIPLHSETDKRNYGLQFARNQGYTHFISMDADEFYDPLDFLKIKNRFHVEPDLNGIVCPVVVYFKSPTLCVGRDITLVPHIHKLTPTIQHSFNRLYPFAWDGKQIRIDPSRSLNINSGVQYTEEIELHHFSWVRKDIEKKIRNSTARMNLERSTIRQDFIAAKEGEMCHFYGKRLYRVANRFNLPEYGVLVQDLQSISAAVKAP